MSIYTCDCLSHCHYRFIRGCCRGSYIRPSDYKAGVLTTWPSCSSVSDSVNNGFLLQVNDIYEAIKDIEKNNVRMLSKEPRIGAHGKPIVFLHPKDMGGVLVELEHNPDDTTKE